MAAEQDTVRDLARQVVPSWLAAVNAYKMVYAAALMVDSQLDASFAALAHRFPGLRSPESLPLIGRERALRRGLFETDSTYARRLRTWISAHKHRGNPYELLRQLAAFHAPQQPTSIQVIYRSGRRFTMAPDGSIAMDDISTWNPDGTPELWATYTVLIYTNFYHAAAVDDRNRALADLRGLVSDFNSVHCLARIIVLGTGSELWAEIPAPPNQPSLTPGTWAEAAEQWSATADIFTVEVP